MSRGTGNAKRATNQAGLLPNTAQYKYSTHARDKYLAFLYVHQNGRCAICRKRVEWVDVKVDHDHGTGLVRGLLCHCCNVALGQFKDDIKIVARAHAYLTAHGRRAIIPLPGSARYSAEGSALDSATQSDLDDT